MPLSHVVYYENYYWNNSIRKRVLRTFLYNSRIFISISVPDANRSQLRLSRGIPTLRHDETRDFVADMMTETWNSVAIEPILTPVDGRTFEHTTITTDLNAGLDMLVGGVWGGRLWGSILTSAFSTHFPNQMLQSPYHHAKSSTSGERWRSTGRECAKLSIAPSCL